MLGFHTNPFLLQTADNVYLVNANQELKKQKVVEKRCNIAENVRCETNKTH